MLHTTGAGPCQAPRSRRSSHLIALASSVEWEWMVRFVGARDAKLWQTELPPAPAVLAISLETGTRFMIAWPAVLFRDNPGP